VIFFKIIFFALLCGLLDYTGPFFINHIIDYITDPNRKLITGVLIVIGIVSSRVILSIVVARLRTLLVRILGGVLKFIFPKAMWGIKTSNALNGVIYSKTLRFSLMRSVEHNQGSLVNHIQVDSERLTWTAWEMSNVMNLPVILGIGIYFLWVSVGISFLSGLGVILIMSLINYVFSKIYFK